MHCAPRWLLVLLALVGTLLPTCAHGLTFGVIGDWAMGGYNVGWFPEVRSTLQFNQQCEYLNCNFTISVGDNVYCGSVVACLQNSFVNGFKSGGPFFPSVGNHDNVGPQIAYSRASKRWKFPSRYYTYKMPIDDTGYTVQIFAVDVMDRSLGGGGQLSWLKKELSKSDARWKVIFGHYPTSSSGRHKRVGTVNGLHDIMKRYNAQAYFCGHDHIVEMSNFYGRVLGLSGGISRGGMMSRGRGGALRRFTLTSPGEYNRWAPDWPTHGFITVDLSPNVMNIQIFEANGGMYYDMSVTWNWMQELVQTMPDSKKLQWPEPSIVLKAYKDEANLPLGPGGGVVFRPDGSMVPSSIGPRNGGSGAPLPSEGDSSSLGTAGTEETNAPEKVETTSTDAPSDPEKAPVVPGFVKYAVSSECVACGNEPTIGLPFTVFVQGVSVSSVCRVFLTSSALGCDVREKPNILSGTEVVTPSSNVVTFTVTGVSATAFVCFSMDKGQTYTRLNRADTLYEATDFVVNPPLELPPTSDVPVGNEQRNERNPSPTAVPTAAPQSSTPQHTSATLVVVACLCVVGGIVGGKYANHIWTTY